MNGLGVFFKYQRLEQYEEALENIAFNVAEETVQKPSNLGMITFLNTFRI